MKTLRMTRDEPAYDGGPVCADVHPAEVDNWLAAGWRTDSKATSTPATSQGEIMDAITVLLDEPDGWTADNLPKTSALSDLLGRAVSADERNAAWVRYQQARAGNGAHT